MNKIPNELTKKNLISMKVCRYTKDGREILNPKPRLALVGPAKPLSDIEKMKKMTQANQMIEEMEKYTETWEETNDFSINSDVDEEFFNTNFTLMDPEMPEKLTKDLDPKITEAADKFIDMAEKIESGEIDPDTISYDFIKKDIDKDNDKNDNNGDNS